MAYASGKKALAICDVCGFRYKYHQLKYVIEDTRRTGIKACPSCWDADHPQLQAGKLRIIEAISLRDPRTDFPEFAESRAQISPVTSLTATGFVGTVTVIT
jgi:hypothetical protein